VKEGAYEEDHPLSLVRQRNRRYRYEEPGERSGRRSAAMNKRTLKSIGTILAGFITVVVLV
jgi:hypothetical protein